MHRASRPAVDFFLRNLTYEFARDDVVGLPGSMIGTRAPLQDDRLIGFIHEAEHVTQLMYPLGTLMTALGLRVLDLRNDSARAVKELDWLPLVKAINRYGDCIFSVHLFAEWVKPAMEGLALVAEMELQPVEGDVMSRAFAAAVAIEVAQWREKLLRTGEGIRVLKAIGAEEVNIVDELMPPAERQIAASRQLRIDGDMIDDVFWGGGDGDGTLPYFTGYLFFKRVEQEWRARVPSLTPRDVHERATVACCDALPLSVLSFLGSDPHTPGEQPSAEFSAAMEYIVNGIPRLSAKSIEVLATPDRMLHFNGALDVVASVDVAGMDGNERLGRLLSPIIVNLFSTDDTDHLRQTIDVLQQLEHAKAIVPVAMREVKAVATAEDGSILLLMDASVTTREVAPNSLTFFKCDAAALNAFAAVGGAEVTRLPRVRLGEAPYHVTITNPPLRLILATYLHFWPNGVNDGEPVRPLRMLVTAAGETLFESDASEYDIETRRVRDFANLRYAEYVARAVDAKFGDLRDMLERVEPLASNDVEQILAARLAEIYCPETLERMRENVRTQFSRIIFGRDVNHVRIRRERWSILADELSNDDVAVLRRALRNGLVFSRDNFTPAPGAEGAARRIRQAALHHLGVPLVRWCESPPGLVLDLVPP